MTSKEPSRQLTLGKPVTFLKNDYFSIYLRNKSQIHDIETCLSKSQSKSSRWDLARPRSVMCIVQELTFFFLQLSRLGTNVLARSRKREIIKLRSYLQGVTKLSGHHHVRGVRPCLPLCGSGVEEVWRYFEVFIGTARYSEGHQPHSIRGIAFRQ